MYLRHFALTRLPFETPAHTDELFESNARREDFSRDTPHNSTYPYTTFDHSSCITSSSSNPTSPTQREFCRFSLFSTTQVIELLNPCTPNSPQYRL